MPIRDSHRVVRLLALMYPLSLDFAPTCSTLKGGSYYIKVEHIKNN